MTVRRWVEWSRTQTDQFLLTDAKTVTVYRVQTCPLGVLPDRFLDLGGGFAAQPINYIEQPSEIRRAAWHPRPELGHLAALALASGEVAIVSLFNDYGDVNEQGDAVGVILKPAVLRPPNDLSWNQQSTQLVAVSYGKGHGQRDAAVQVFNVNASIDVCVPSKPFFTAGNGESSASNAWHPGSGKPLFLFASFSKAIRGFDLRVSSRDSHNELSIPTRNSAHNLAVNPHNTDELAASVDHQVQVWDIRNTAQPLHALTEPGIVQLAWNRHQPSAINYITKQSSYVIKEMVLPGGSHNSFSAFDDSQAAQINRFPMQSFHSTMSQNTHLKAEPLVDCSIYLNRVPRKAASTAVPGGRPAANESGAMSPKGGESSLANLSHISSFSQHPTVIGRFLAVNLAGFVTMTDVSRPLHVAFLPNGVVANTNGAGKVKLRPVPCSQDEVKLLAEAGYTVGNALQNHALLLQYRPDLAQRAGSVWPWVANSRNLMHYSNVGGQKLIGVRSILNNPARKPSTPTKVDFSSRLQAPVYESPERTSIFRLVGWLDTFEGGIRQGSPPPPLKRRVDAVLAAGDVEHAALLATFALDLDSVEKILSNATSVEARLGALAIDGAILAERRPLHAPRVQNASLRLLFKFVLGFGSTTLGDNSDEFMKDFVLSADDWLGLDQLDRIGFVARFVSDNHLNHVLDELWNEYYHSGPRLDGLVLSGLPSEEGEGMHLLQRYLDNTDDLQTAALLVGETSLPATDPKQSICGIYESYVDLLDRLGLWLISARMNAYVKSGKDQTGTVGRENVLLLCSFCSRPVALSGTDRIETASPTRQHLSWAGTARSGSCPKCTRPLPRCVICEAHMFLSSVATNGASDEASVLAGWFAWCQRCLHGGHLGHLHVWFESNVECPVNGCSCQCTFVDGSTLEHWKSRPIKP